MELHIHDKTGLHASQLIHKAFKAATAGEGLDVPVLSAKLYRMKAEPQPDGRVLVLNAKGQVLAEISKP